ncbi:hypothetical protein HID58_090237 [Brassica napus]|uniref:Uncharacterized protein n=1 Tax=Brassica napus TaxID=3708 RepID=A0ABQ7X9D4_BRANA|nr:hypothetical protein HID58_090237 [Brassica napus]
MAAAVVLLQSSFSPYSQRFSHLDASPSTLCHHRCFYFQPSHIPSKIRFSQIPPPSSSEKRTKFSENEKKNRLEIREKITESEKLEWYESSSPVSLGQRAKRDGEEDGLNLKKKVGCLHCYEPMLSSSTEAFFLNDGDSSGSSFTTSDRSGNHEESGERKMMKNRGET